MRRVPPMGFFKAGGEPSYSANVLADSPLAYWRCGEGSGSSMLDSSGNGLDGNYQGGTDLTQSGKYAGTTCMKTYRDGYAFGYVNPTVPATLRFASDDPFSIELWVKLSEYNIGAFISCLDSGHNYRGWELWPISNTKIQFSFATSLVPGTNGIALAFYNAATLVGNWRHIVATYDGSKTAAGVHMYRDGEPSTPDAADQNNLTTDAAYTYPLRIGNRGGTLATNNGLIGEVAAYGTELSATRISAHFASTEA